MTGSLLKAFGYQGDNLHLPAKSVDEAVPFYVGRLGFRWLSHSDSPQRSALLGRDEVRIGLVENGGDPTQDGCAFHVESVDALHAEFRANGLQKEMSEFRTERRDNADWKVFFVIAPDGLCYWFGERQG